MAGPEPGQRPSLDERRVIVEERKAALEERKAAAENRFFRRHFAAVATALISLATIVFSIVQWRVGTRMAETEALQISRRDDRDYDMETYKVVMTSVSSKDSIQQRAALTLAARVNDSTLKEALREALQRAGTAPIRIEAAEKGLEEQRYNREQAELATQTSASQWRYDVFHCEASGARAEQAAGEVVARLRGQAAIRTRVLTRWINGSPGYRVSGYQVRYESSEEERARDVLQRLNSAPGNALPQFTGIVVGSTTPNYLSVFVCP
jgi:hypothetical protein